MSEKPFTATIVVATHKKYRMPTRRITREITFPLRILAIANSRGFIGLGRI